MPTPEEMAAALSPAMQRYPDWTDASFAQMQGFTHARPDSPYLEGKKYTYNPNMRDVIDVYRAQDNNSKARIRSTDTFPKQAETLNAQNPGLSDLYQRGALAAKRSALAQLGWDPPNTVLNFTPNILQAGRNTQTAGFYVPPTGQTWVNAHNYQDNPATMVHESIHRGIHKLQETGYWDPAWNSLGTPLPRHSSERNPEGNGGTNNELVVRWLMKNKMGNPEGANSIATDFQNQAAQIFDDPNSRYRKHLDAMEAAASRYLKDRNPRGPR